MRLCFDLPFVNLNASALYLKKSGVIYVACWPLYMICLWHVCTFLSFLDFPPSITVKWFCSFIYFIYFEYIIMFRNKYTEKHADKKLNYKPLM